MDAGLFFLLAAAAIACLLFEFYRLCPMRFFTLFIFLPAMAVLAIFACSNGNVATANWGGR